MLLRKRRSVRLSERSKQDSNYKAWIKLQPCLICGRYGTKEFPSDPAHTKVFGTSGMSQRSPDRSCVPLCHWDHTERWDSYHRIANETRWAEMHGIDLPARVREYNAAYEERAA